MAINLDDVGIQSIATALVESFELSKEIQVSDPVKTSAGGFHAAQGFNPSFKFSIKGRGDTPAAFALGGAGGPLEMDGVTGGKTIVTDLEDSEKSDSHNSFSVDGVNFPAAS